MGDQIGAAVGLAALVLAVVIAFRRRERVEGLPAWERYFWFVGRTPNPGSISRSAGFTTKLP